MIIVDIYFGCLCSFSIIGASSSFGTQSFAIEKSSLSVSVKALFVETKLFIWVWSSFNCVSSIIMRLSIVSVKVTSFFV